MTDFNCFEKKLFEKEKTEKKKAWKKRQRERQDTKRKRNKRRLLQRMLSVYAGNLLVRGRQPLNSLSLLRRFLINSLATLLLGDGIKNQEVNYGIIIR